MMLRSITFPAHMLIINDLRLHNQRLSRSPYMKKSSVLSKAMNMSHLSECFLFTASHTRLAKSEFSFQYPKKAFDTAYIVLITIIF